MAEARPHRCMTPPIIGNPEPIAIRDDVRQLSENQNNLASHSDGDPGCLKAQRPNEKIHAKTTAISAPIHRPQYHRSNFSAPSSLPKLPECKRQVHTFPGVVHLQLVAGGKLVEANNDVPWPFKTTRVLCQCCRKQLSNGLALLSTCTIAFSGHPLTCLPTLCTTPEIEPNPTWDTLRNPLTCRLARRA